MVDVGPIAKLETSGPNIATVVDPDENIIWKNSAWLGTGIMIDRETPLTEIVGQMSLSRSTEVAHTRINTSHQP